ncbi:MAG TPA: ATP-binding protein [Chloroflexia bacterium]|jgi:hypothetical protein
MKNDGDKTKKGAAIARDVDELQEGGSARGRTIETVVLSKDFSVKARLADLREWRELWLQKLALIQARRAAIDVTKGENIGSALTALETRWEMLQVKVPFAWDHNAVVAAGGYNKLQDHMTTQYAALQRKDQLLWLRNFYFVLTDQLSALDVTISRLPTRHGYGQARNLMIAAPSGMGKTSYLNFLCLQSPQELRDQYTKVPIAKADAQAGENSIKPLLSNFLGDYGVTFAGAYTEKRMLNALATLIPRSETERLIVDEVQNLKSRLVRRKLLDLSNQVPWVPIIIASVTPSEFTRDDEEIAGRWSELVTLHPYTGKRLGSLLNFLELLLPFGQPSYLPARKLADNSEGPAEFIEKWSGGVLKQIIYLICDAAIYAILKGHSSITVPALKMAAKRLRAEAPPHFSVLLASAIAAGSTK